MVARQTHQKWRCTFRVWSSSVVPDRCERCMVMTIEFVCLVLSINIIYVQLRLGRI